MHNIDEVMLTRKLNLDLLNPTSGTLFLGDERKAFVDQQVDNSSAVGGVIEKVNKLERLNQLEVSDTEPEDKTKLWCDTSGETSVFKRWNGDFWEVINDQNEMVNQVYEVVNTTIKQASDSVMVQVGEEYYLKSDTDKMLSSMRTEYKQTSSEFEFKFKQFEQNLEDVQSGTDAKFKDVSKYIRFIDGSILLGQVGNAFQVQIKHNRISFLENNMEVAYIADRKIYITDGEFINSLRIGSFSFRPRKNGNLSFGKVV